MNQITDAKNKGGGFLTQSRWNPYFVGIGIGLLSWAVFAIVNAPLGVTTSLSQWAGLAAEPMMGVEGVRANPYGAKDLPKWDYGTFFLIGTFFGALVGAWLSRDLKIEVVPTVWRERFGGSPGKRLAVAFVGGILAMYGARMAGGCTIGKVRLPDVTGISDWVWFVILAATAAIMFYAIERLTTES